MTPQHVSELAEELAELTGETVEQAMEKALRERLDRERRRPIRADRGREDTAQRLMEIGRRCSRLPDLDPRAANDLIGYDEAGLPE